MINVSHSLILIFITAGITFLLRAFPFILFGGNRQMPEKFKKIADSLPSAIIAVLVIYCLKGDLFVLTRSALASLIAIIYMVIIRL